MILPIPAIDIINGQCVRLEKGDYSRMHIYSDSPLEMALYWERKNAPMLHLIDLDGAKNGKPVNLSIILKIIQSIRIPVEVGGGIRNLSTFLSYLDAGAQRIIFGSVAIQNPQFIKDCIKRSQESVVVSIDSRDGLVALQGWTEKTTVSAVDLTNKLKNLGVMNFIFTDIERDGTLQGVNINHIQKYLQETKVPTFIAGGVTTLDDILQLKKLNAWIKGIILGKALYSGALQFEEVQKILQEEEKCSLKE
ncbi:MAG: 1-(5-phosphoribosyl)-5-[(5-phosphoribosylamino)methylideneamino]imidazole-4-carboxamide isomerase [Candidatus Atribacteria bacterium]|nr:1-(5-phosphoribosyl)-5-[(5-phosphoribosylamino)methylideneamino]imidazole-4-carboxamide isomerase [Candidatus Atribacteria bacterium]